MAKTRLRYAAGLCLSVVALALWSGTLCWLCSYHDRGVMDARASIAHIGARDVLLIEGDEHPPWAQSHVISADIDHDRRTITVTEKYAVFTPFGSAGNTRWPIILDSALVLPRYTVQYWNGERHVPIGEVLVHDKTKEFLKK